MTERSKCRLIIEKYGRNYRTTQKGDSTVKSRNRAVARVITAAEANAILSSWSDRNLDVCLAVCHGDSAYMTQHIGKLRSFNPGIYEHASGHTASLVTTDRFEELLLIEHTEGAKIRFRKAHGVQDCNFEIWLLIRTAGFDDGVPPLLTEMIQ